MRKLASLLFACLWGLALAAGSPANAQTETPTPEPLEGETTVVQTHIVESGDTLFAIATHYGTTVEILQQLNNIADPSALALGQELILPGGEGEISAALHILQLGDTLARVASRP